MGAVRGDGAPAGQDGRLPDVRRGGLDAERVDDAPDPEPRAVDERLRPRPCNRRTGLLLVREMASDPGLALAQERLDVGRRLARPRPAGRDGHDHAADRVDDEAEPTGAARAAERVGQRPAGQLDPLGGLAGDRGARGHPDR